MNTKQATCHFVSAFHFFVLKRNIDILRLVFSSFFLEKNGILVLIGSNSWSCSLLQLYKLVQVLFCFVSGYNQRNKIAFIWLKIFNLLLITAKSKSYMKTRQSKTRIIHFAYSAWCKRRLLSTQQWQSALLVVGPPVIRDWFEMGCQLSLSLIQLGWRRERGLPFVSYLHPDEEEG